MKVIQNNNVKKDKKIEENYICEECNSVFVYDDYDIFADENGVEFVTCPCCGHSCVVYIPVTPNNIKFPKNFYQFGVREGAIKIDNEEITFRIKEIIGFLARHPEEPYRYEACGDTFICVFNHDDEYYIMVAKNYFETSIDKR